jgi:hypothetical protein
MNETLISHLGLRSDEQCLQTLSSDRSQKCKKLSKDAESDTRVSPFLDTSRALARAWVLRHLSRAAMHSTFQLVRKQAMKQ